MNVCAGIVLYNPDIARLHENIKAIIGQVSEIVLVDNGSANVYEAEEVANQYGNKVSIIINDKNYGIAKALNQILEFADDKQYPVYITLDQDSVCSENLIEKYLEVYQDNIGQISCNIVDRHIGNVDKVEFLNKSTRLIEHCITSGCINNTHAVKECGGYNETLFIDGVDLDLSCKLREYGYDVLCINYDGLLHELGDGRQIKAFGKTISVANHAPWRNYYTRRNLIYVARKYYKGFSRINKLSKQILYAIGTIILEDKKIERIKYNFNGIKDGMFMKTRD